MIELDAFIWGPGYGPTGGGWMGRKCCRGEDCGTYPQGACQCVALACEWCCANGWPVPQGGTAATLRFAPGWVRVPIGQARAGDLVVWLSDLPDSDGDGHVAVYRANLSSGFQSFDQNWGQDLCELVAHSYAYIDSAWRWEPAPAPPPPPPGPRPASWPLSGYDLTGEEL